MSKTKAPKKQPRARVSESRPLDLKRSDADIILEGLMHVLINGGDTLTWKRRCLALIDLVASTFGISQDELDEMHGQEQDFAEEQKSRARAPEQQKFTPLDEL